MSSYGAKGARTPDQWDQIFTFLPIITQFFIFENRS